MEVEQYQGIAEIACSLAEIDYSCESQDIRAEDVGAPHKRERIWIVAYPDRLGRIKGGERRSVEKEGFVSKQMDREISYPASERRECRENGEPGQQTQCGKTIFRRRNSREMANSDTAGLQETRPEQPTAGVAECCKEISNTTEPGLFAECGQWTIEPEICRIFDELSEMVDGHKKGYDNFFDFLTLCLTHYIMGYYGTEKKNFIKALFVLWEKDESESLWKREIGRFYRIQETEVLRSEVYGRIANKGDCEKGAIQQEGKAIHKKELRKLPNKGEASRSSHGFGCDEQPSGKHKNSMCYMSPEMALAEWESNKKEKKLFLQNMWRACQEIGYVPETLYKNEEIWQSFTDEEKDWIVLRVGGGSFWRSEFPNTGRLTTQPFKRRQQLQGLGNAIVPQIAELLFKRIKELTCTTH